MISLDELTPEQVAKLPAPERRRVILRCSTLIQGAASADDEGPPALPNAAPDRLIDIKEVARRLNIAVSTARHRHFPFRVKGTRMFSERGLDEHIRKGQR